MKAWWTRWWKRNIVDEDPDAPVLEPPAAHGCCEVCGDDSSLYLHSRCHPNSATWAIISGNILTIECAYCGKLIQRFLIVKWVED